MGFISDLDNRLQLPARATRMNGWLYRRLPAAIVKNRFGRLFPSEAYDTLNREVSRILSRPIRDLQARDASPWLSHRLSAILR